MDSQKVQATEDLEVTLAFKERMGIGIAGFATNLVWSSMSSYILFYYTDVIGLSAALLSTMMLFVRLLDGGADIGMGMVVDRTHSKYGKARPWVKWLAIPFGISCMLLFSVPDLGATGSFIYATVTYVIVNLIYTALNIPLSTLSALVTKSQYERSVLQIFNTILSTICTLLVMNIVLPMVKIFGNGRMGWFITFTIFGVIATILFFYTFYSTKERVTEATVKKEKVPFKIGFKALFTNKYWVIIVLLLVTAFLNMGIGGSVALYFTTYIMKNAEFLGIISIASRIPSVLVLAVVCAPLVKRYGKKNVVMAGSIISVIGKLVMVIDMTSPVVVLIASVILGVGGGMLGAGSFAFLADTVEYGEWKSGVRTEGLIFSAASFGLKVGTGLATAIVGWGLAYFGYHSGAVTQTAHAIQGIEFLYIWLPLGLSIVQVILLCFYDLDKIYPQIMKDLNARNRAKNAE